MSPNRNRRQLIDSMLRQQNKPTPRFGLPPETRRALILVLWAALMCCVVIGSLLPAASPVIVDIGRLHINDKVMHFCAYLALSFLPVIGFQDRRRGIVAGLSMFLLGVLMEAGQHFSPPAPSNSAIVLPTARASVAAPCWACQSASFWRSSEPRAIPPCAVSPH
jgi:VanZ family protein